MRYTRRQKSYRGKLLRGPLNKMRSLARGKYRRKRRLKRRL